MASAIELDDGMACTWVMPQRGVPKSGAASLAWASAHQATRAPYADFTRDELLQTAGLRRRASERARRGRAGRRGSGPGSRRYSGHKLPPLTPVVAGQEERRRLG
jgi:hypothetical protein